MRRVRIVADYEYHDGATEEAIAQLMENAHTDESQRCRARGYTGTINVRDAEPTLRTSIDAQLPSVWVCRAYADIADPQS
jgi:hypothetical protein